MAILSEFFSDPKSGYSRRATVSTVANGYDGAYIVDMFDGEFLADSRMIEGHTQQYAEDCAENWVLGVIK